MKKNRSFLLSAAAVGVLFVFANDRAKADTVFVTNNGDDSVEEINNGVVSTFTTSDLAGPTGIAVYGDNVYVANIASPYAGYVSEYTLSGSFEGVVLGGLNGPRGLTFDSQGNLYVTNQSNGNIVEVPTGGGLPTLIGSGLGFPNGLATDNSGNLYVASGGGNLIDKISLTGGDTITPLVTTGLNSPVGIAYEGGDIYVVNDRNSVVEYNATTGATVAPTPFITDLNTHDNLDDIAIDSQGDFYVTDNGDNKVTEYDSSGNIIATYSGTDFDGPCYVTTYTPPVAVPEPSTCLMLLGGFGVLFFFLRRRQSAIL